MNIVLFYEKPGCVTNAGQKKLLREAGCMVIERNLLNHGMSIEELYTFFDNIPVVQWFNPNAPKIKSGEVDPASMGEKAALQLLLMEPILIRRPLLVVAGKKMCGFDQERVERLLDTRLEHEAVTECSSKNETCN